MALDHSLVGLPGEPYERSWTSTDARFQTARQDGTVVIDRGRMRVRD